MFRKPILTICRDCAQGMQSSRRPVSTLIKRSEALPKRPSATSRLQAQSARAPTQQRRHAGTFMENAKSLYRDYPVSVTTASFIILFGVFSIGYINYYYQTYIIGAFHKFPEEVAKKLRRALYYTNQDFQPREALKYYKQALQVSEELGMDPFSDEIMGVKIQIAAMMEKIPNIPKAIQVLEILRSDCLKWQEQLGDLERNKEKRTRVLAKTIAISVKLGELYANPYVYEPAIAEEHLTWAVETSIRESQRRQRENVRDEDEGPWLSNDEMGAALEALAHTFEEKDNHYLASPLFLQALTLKTTPDCHSVVLMNNLATALAQQRTPTVEEGQKPVTRADMVQSATEWANKALELAATMQPPERTEECDVGCAVALHNLAEFAEMRGDVKEAQKRYREAISLAKAVGFAEGASHSQERLTAMGKAASIVQKP